MVRGKMREGGVDDEKDMLSDAEGVWSLGGRETLSSMRDGICVRLAVAGVLVVSVGVVVLMVVVEVVVSVIVVRVFCIGVVEVVGVLCIVGLYRRWTVQYRRWAVQEWLMLWCWWVFCGGGGGGSGTGGGVCCEVRPVVCE